VRRWGKACRACATVPVSIWAPGGPLIGVAGEPGVSGEDVCEKVGKCMSSMCQWVSEHRRAVNRCRKWTRSYWRDVCEKVGKGVSNMCHSLSASEYLSTRRAVNRCRRWTRSFWRESERRMWEGGGRRVEQWHVPVSIWAPGGQLIGVASEPGVFGEDVCKKVAEGVSSMCHSASEYLSAEHQEGR
jgi:hypothetical protein